MTGNPPKLPHVWLDEPTLLDFDYLVKHMRADERDQHNALHGDEQFDAHLACFGMVNYPGPRFVLRKRDGWPLVMGGFTPTAPGVVQTWMIGSDAAWSTHWRSITKMTRTVMRNMLAHGDVHRIQTLAIASRPEACSWYERGLGMTREGISRAFTPRGDDVVHFSLIKADL